MISHTFRRFILKRNNKKRFLFGIALFVLVGLLLSPPAVLLAEEHEMTTALPETIRGKILEITEAKSDVYSEPGMDDGYKIHYYDVKINVLEGEHKGETIMAEHVVDDRMVYKLHVDVGDEVLLYVEENEQGEIAVAYIAEIYRQKYLIVLLVLFLVSLVVLGRLKGVKTVLTLGLTGVAVVKILLPGLLAGYNPLLLTVGISALVTALTLFIISGINRKTIAAIIGTTGGVFTAGIIAVIFGSMAKLTGLGDEQAQMLMFIPQQTGFDYKGLLFAGIIIGALGAVMDVGMSIASAMHEIRDIKPDIKTSELIRAGMNVGRDVMGTMSNTLILAYAGASLPLLLLFMAHEIPVQEFVNWDTISSEVVRALAGSIGLVLTIPLTAVVTAALRERKKPDGLQ